MDQTWTAGSFFLKMIFDTGPKGKLGGVKETRADKVG